MGAAAHRRSRAHPPSVVHLTASCSILPPTGENDPDLYGAVTAEATSRPEIRAPKRRRVFSMAVTATDGRDRGQPTSWSAAVDALAAGRSFDPSDNGLKYIDEHEEAFRRLFVLSAGNIEGPALERDHTECPQPSTELGSLTLRWRLPASWPPRACRRRRWYPSRITSDSSRTLRTDHCAVDGWVL